MTPRTYTASGREVYECRGRRNDPDACSQLPIPRKTVDTTVLSYFEDVALDLAASRAEIAEGITQALADQRAIREEAERTVAQKQASLSRVRADYLSGEITGKTYEQFEVQLLDELRAADAEMEQLRRHEEELMQAAGPSAEDQIAERLAELRAAVAGRVKESVDLPTVRAILARLFEMFIVTPYHPEQQYEGPAAETVRAQHAAVAAETREWGVETLTPGKPGWSITVLPREEVFEGLDERWRPVLARQSLSGTTKSQTG